MASGLRRQTGSRRKWTALALSLGPFSSPGGRFLHGDSLAAMKRAASATTSTTRPIVSLSHSDANEAGKAVLRSYCVEPLVVACNVLELLSLACSAAQHGLAGRTKRGSCQVVD
jgi:hypothetical protein